MIIKMNEDIVRKNSLKAWFLASRPKTLTAASVPVMLAAVMAWKTHEATGTEFSITAAILCFLFAFMMQIDANFVNDYFDCIRGNDDETRLGPKRACAMGWISLNAMKAALVITTLLCCAIGAPLILYGGIEMIAVGLACVLFCFLYTTCLSYWGLGDVLVLVFFGIVPVCCSWYVMLPQHDVPYEWRVLAVSIACGIVIDTLLIINNYRDIDNDRRAGKRTLAVFLGRKYMSLIYFASVPIACIIMLIAYPMDLMYLLTFFVSLFHVNTYWKMKAIGQGKELNQILGMTARNIFIFGILSSIAIFFI